MNFDPTQSTARADDTPRSGMRRRTLLVTAGVAASALAGCTRDGPPDWGWIEADSPTEKTLYAAVMTAEGPCAVGEDGCVLVRQGEDWSVLDADGPAGAANGLHGAAVTDEGRRVWFCGTSGAVGRYDVVEGTVTDHSAPGGETSTWEDAAVVGRVGRERIHLANGSGELLAGSVGTDGIAWSGVGKPATGTSASAVSYVDGAGFLADTAGGVYRTTDGEPWRRIGLRSESDTPLDLVALDAETVAVATNEGAIASYNGFNWLRSDLGDTALHAVDREGARGLAVGTNGVIHELGENDWNSKSTPTSRPLYGAALGTAEDPDVAVGDNGTVLERVR